MEAPLGPNDSLFGVSRWDGVGLRPPCWLKFLQREQALARKKSIEVAEVAMSLKPVTDGSDWVKHSSWWIVPRT